jgi:hypothetical protein
LRWGRETRGASCGGFLLATGVDKEDKGDEYFVILHPLKSPVTKACGLEYLQTEQEMKKMHIVKYKAD